MAEPKPQSAPPGAQPAVQQGTQASGPVQHGTPAGAPQAAVGTSPAQGAVPAGTAGTGAPQQPDAPKQPDASKQPDDDGRGARRPGFRQRGRMRRRLSYLRTARELSYRDLGGLTFDLYRFGGRREELMGAKLTRLGQIDSELRALEHVLEDEEPITVLRRAGVLACPRCAEIHSDGDRFCPHCGMPAAADAERPVTMAPAPATTIDAGRPAPPPAPLQSTRPTAIPPGNPQQALSAPAVSRPAPPAPAQPAPARTAAVPAVPPGAQPAPQPSRPPAPVMPATQTMSPAVQPAPATPGSPETGVAPPTAAPPPPAPPTPSAPSAEPTTPRPAPAAPTPGAPPAETTTPRPAPAQTASSPAPGGPRIAAAPDAPRPPTGPPGTGERDRAPRADEPTEIIRRPEAPGRSDGASDSGTE